MTKPQKPNEAIESMKDALGEGIRVLALFADLGRAMIEQKIPPDEIVHVRWDDGNEERELPASAFIDAATVCDEGA